MALISVQDLTFGYDGSPELLFEHASFAVLILQFEFRRGCVDWQHRSTSSCLLLRCRFLGCGVPFFLCHKLRQGRDHQPADGEHAADQELSQAFIIHSRFPPVSQTDSSASVPGR